MKPLKEEVFICLDCETTGLDTSSDRIIEIAAVKFTFEKKLESFEALIDPQVPIPAMSQAVHNISSEMLAGKPQAKEALAPFFKFLQNHTLIGHSIQFDLQILQKEAQRSQIPCSLDQAAYIDTLRLARLYGESPVNSLQMLREHFNIAPEGAHRAMNDVTVNIEVFKKLSQKFKTLKELMERLKKPILMKIMPLGKHKGRKFSEIPIDYLRWAIKKDFDMDLLYSIKTEIRKRESGKNFYQASNPFSHL